MGKERAVSYFASSQALGLWLAISALAISIVAYRLLYSPQEASLVKSILLITDLLHFWLPIFAAKYLDRLAKES